MSDNFEKLFNKLERFEPSEKLRANILARIDFEKRRSSRIRLAVLGTVVAASFGAVIPSFQYAWRAFFQSGFYEYLSLLFSDSGAVLASWKTFILSLAETIPLAEMTIFLIAVFVFLFSARLAIKSVKSFYDAPRLRINY